jgi:hypothetical protein
MAERLERAEIANEAQKGSDLSVLFPLLLVLFAVAVTAVWVGFLVWLPLYWLGVI